VTKTNFVLTTHEREWRNPVSGVIGVHSINKTVFRQKKLFSSWGNVASWVSKTRFFRKIVYDYVTVLWEFQ